MTDLYSEWRDFYAEKVLSWMSLEELRAECGKLLTVDSPSPEVLLIHAMHVLERYEQRNEALRAEVDVLKAENKRLLDALRQITEWPDGGNRYGQENIKRFAKAAIDAAMRKENSDD